MTRAAGVLRLLGVCVAVHAAGAWAAEEPAGDQAVLRTKSGLHFRVPADWPIEERNGVTGPIPTEEYITRKFSTLETRIRTLEQQLSGTELRLRVLEESQRAGAASGSRLRSGEGSP